MRIAVTGGSGFLGQAVMQQLVQLGYSIKSISRGLTETKPAPAPVATFTCDINHTSDLQDIFQRCDCVIHCAALSAPWGRWGDFQKQNVLGTESVVKAAKRAQVPRLIHVSSSSVYFSYADRIGIREESTLPKPVNAYAKSKQMAEVAAHQFPGELFILRPRGIFGPGDPHLLPRLLRVMKTRSLPLLRKGEALVDITDVAVVASAISAMVSAPAHHAGTFNISQGEPIMIRDLVERISRGVFVPCRWRPVPTQLAFTTARLLEVAARLDPKHREPLVTAYGLGLFAYTHTLDISKAQRLLQWRPNLSLEDSLQRTFASLQDGP